jgi:hypothetical protein
MSRIFLQNEGESPLNSICIIVGIVISGCLRWVNLLSEEFVAEKTKGAHFRKRDRIVTLGTFQVINWQYDK